MLIQIHPFYSADGAGGASGDDDTDDTGKVRGSDILQKYGTTADAAMRLAERVAELENRNYRLRRDKEALTSERDALKGKVPGEGSVVLSAADAAALEAYRTHGAPEEIAQALETGKATQERLAGLERAELIRTAAEAHDYKPSALAKLPSLAGAALVIREQNVTEGGKPVKKPRAFVVQQDGKEVALPDYIQANDPEFLPALHQQPAGDGVGSPAGGRRPSGRPEVPAPPTHF